MLERNSLKTSFLCKVYGCEVAEHDLVEEEQLLVLQCMAGRHNCVRGGLSNTTHPGKLSGGRWGGGSRVGGWVSVVRTFPACVTTSLAISVNALGTY